MGALPVVEKDKLVGIITETNIFDAFIDLLGVKEQGCRIDMEVEDVPGVLADVTQIIKKTGKYFPGGSIPGRRQNLYRHPLDHLLR